MLTILFDGIAYGMLLFVLACGLAVTLGLMNFVNLAHGAFAMAGGYCLVVLVNQRACLLCRVAGSLPVQRRTWVRAGADLYVHLYRKPHLIRCCSRSAWSSCPWRGWTM